MDTYVYIYIFIWIHMDRYVDSPMGPWAQRWRLDPCPGPGLGPWPWARAWTLTLGQGQDPAPMGQGPAAIFGPMGLAHGPMVPWENPYIKPYVSICPYVFI